MNVSLRMPSVVTTTVLLLALGACASAPDVRYYTLDMTRSNGTRPTVNLVVEDLGVADALGRRQIMIQESPTRIEYYAVDQWAGHVGELVTQKLRVELGPAVADRRTFTVSGTVVECGQADGPGGAEARAAIRIELRDPALGPRSAPLLTDTYSCNRSAGAGSPDGTAKALSRCVEEIAAEIAADAGAL